MASPLRPQHKGLKEQNHLPGYRVHRHTSLYVDVFFRIYASKGMDAGIHTLCISNLSEHHSKVIVSFFSHHNGASFPHYDGVSLAVYPWINHAHPVPFANCCHFNPSYNKYSDLKLRISHKVRCF